LEKLLLIAISGKVLYVGFEALIKPVVAWDAWTSWAFKSKIFFFNNVPLISYFRDYPIGIVDYPLHLPLRVSDHREHLDRTIVNTQIGAS